MNENSSRSHEIVKLYIENRPIAASGTAGRGLAAYSGCGSAQLQICHNCRKLPLHYCAVCCSMAFEALHPSMFFCL